MEIFLEAAGPSSEDAGTSDVTAVEQRFSIGACVTVADRPWMGGGQGVITFAHPDGTYEVPSINMSTKGNRDVTCSSRR